MRSGRSTGNMTKAERAWVSATKRNGCLCCIARGYPHDREGHVVEAQHLLDGGIRRGHMFTVGLCLWHHKGRLIVNGWTHATHRRLLGPSLAEGSVPFNATFGTDDELLEAQKALNASTAIEWRNAA